MYHPDLLLLYKIHLDYRLSRRRYTTAPVNKIAKPAMNANRTSTSLHVSLATPARGMSSAHR